MQNLSLEEVQKRARKGPMMLILRRGASIILTLLSTILVARLLTPRQYGLAAMSTVVLSFMQVFRDFGLTNALMRKGHVDPEDVNFLFWFNLGATFIIAALIAIAAPAIANFYHEPIVAQTIWVSLIGFTVSGAAMQFNAVLKRDIRFDVVAGAEAAALTMSLIVSATLAYFFRNVWAIVLGNLAQALTLALIYFCATTWRPSKPKMIPNVGELLSFGMNSSLFTIMNFVSRNAGTLIIGRIVGPVELGLYNRSNALYQMPLSNLLEPLAQAALPVMARLRPYPNLYAQTYIQLVEKLCCVLAPAAAFVFVIAPSLILTMLGPKWGAAGPVLSALAPSLAIYGLFWPTSDLLISQNRSSELRTSGIYDMVLRAGGAFIGAHFGLTGAAIGLSLGTICTVPFRVGISGRSGPVSAMDQYRAFLPSVPIGLAVLAASEAAMWLCHSFNLAPPMQCVAAGLASMVALAPVMVIFPASRRVTLDVVRTLTGKYKPATA